MRLRFPVDLQVEHTAGLKDCCFSNGVLTSKDLLLASRCPTARGGSLGRRETAGQGNTRPNGDVVHAVEATRRFSTESDAGAYWPLWLIAFLSLLSGS